MLISTSGSAQGWNSPAEENCLGAAVGQEAKEMMVGPPTREVAKKYETRKDRCPAGSPKKRCGREESAVLGPDPGLAGQPQGSMRPPEVACNWSNGVLFAFK